MILKGLYSVLIIISMFCSQPLYGQDYQTLINTCFLYLKNNPKILSDEYINIYPAYCIEENPEYQKAIDNIRIGNNAESIKSINALIFQGELLEEIKEDNRFDILHSLPEWKDIISRIDSLQKDEYASLRKELLNLQKEDQSIRLLLLESYKKYGRSDAISLKIREYMKSIDSLNSVRIQHFLDVHGWLGKDKLGEDGNETLFLCIQHSDDSILQDKYLPILKDAVKLGNAEPWHYAFLVDRILMNKGEKQIYGTQKIISDDPTKSYLIPLRDPDNVDKLREEIGLGAIEDDLKEDGLKWNLEEYKKNLPVIEKMYKERYERIKQ